MSNKMAKAADKGTMRNIAMIALTSTALSACGAIDRIADIGKAPDLQQVEQRPVVEKGYSLGLPMPAANNSHRQSNSLWRTGAKAFFQDQRANNIGDIVTVVIDISDQAKVGNTTARSRSTSEGAEGPNLLGMESQLQKILPDEVDPSSLIDFGSTSSTTGTGTVDRSESISLTVAAIVTQILPNGNMMIQGRQEVRVNFEVRELYIAGIIRPEDIANGNTIDHTQIAEARISYGGRGQLTDMQQARYGQQLYEILFPF